MVKVEKILQVFMAYKKLLMRQNKLLRAFDMDGYLKLHPDRMELSVQYQATVEVLLEIDLQKMKIPREMKLKMQKLLRGIQDDLELQKKLLTYAQKTQESYIAIHRSYAEKASVTTYKANGHRPMRRQAVLSLSEMS